MTVEKKFKETVLRLVDEDITLMDVDAFVFYARTDLQLGTGIGNAITMRGGPGVQEELDKIGSAQVGQAVLTSAGKLKAKNIIHAVGPTFQEADTEGKLQKTTVAVLEAAEKNQVQKLAFPPMGSGFYGIAPDQSAQVMLATISAHLKNKTGLKEVFICARDPRDMKPFSARLQAMS